MLPALWAIIGLALATPLLAFAYLYAQMRWLVRNTTGNRYFGRPLAERRAFVAELGRRARTVVPLAEAMNRVWRRRFPTTEVRGVTAPRMGCPRKHFAAAMEYRPDERDVFVATQMKCGTTWAQQIVYETLLHGRGNLGDDGHRHMYALSPWIEATTSVSMDDAPRITDRQLRIIKTHFPASVCPFSESARYVYVARNPVACFASCVDFIRMLGGPLAFTLPEFVDWFCSDRMWWRSWPEHVSGWWALAQERSNILFLHYEDMLEDLPTAVDRVAGFLDVELSPDERARVVEKSSYDFMKAHDYWFEMHPPSFFSVSSETGYFVGGDRQRDKDVGDAERARVVEFVKQRLAGDPYPLDRYYPDL